ncbi:MAG TPA: coenzyme F420-0:L-glutamate ligase [Steroidobacter sp.]|jgi:coenzyme F420-0:L-glutamate ligase/coenzyme F420-1:gamma-L-glutamate ligase|nr:coenzyme F420-0:L-glutamate ligase [Steroidobacter sp.]
MSSIQFTALAGLPEITPGADLARLLAESLDSMALALEPTDVLVVAQKIVSKAEGRYVNLSEVTPSARARELAEITGKDARLVEVVLSESVHVLRAQPDVLIVRHRLGYVMANAGVDRSNVASDDGERVLLLPLDPDGSAAQLRSALANRCGVAVGVLISDSFGRPWRNGVVNIALGAAGLPALIDRRGELDRQGRKLEVTEVALGDAIAAAAGIVMGEAAEGTPAALARGLNVTAPARNARSLIRPLEKDLFR